MKRYVSVGTLCWLAFLAGASGLQADTIPGGDVSGTWYAANSPYYISGNITIPENDTLIIDPGVEVNFLGVYSLTANGLLKAVGTETDSIRFFPNDPTEYWWGIQLNDSLSDFTYQLSYCTFERMMLGIHNYTRAGNAAISSCRFYSCLYGIYWQPSQDVNLQVNDCVFQSGMYSAIRTISGGGLFEVNGCLFENHIGMDYTDPTIYATGRTGTLNIANCVFRNNRIWNAGGAAIHCSSCDSVSIEECVFAGNIDYNISLEGGGAIFLSGTDANIFRCIFYDNDLPSTSLGDAIMLSRPGSWAVDHCTFWGYVPGGNNVNIYVQGGPDTLSALSISNSIFTDASFNLAIQSSLTLSVEYNDFYNNGANISGTIPPGFGMLNAVNINGDSCDVFGNIFMEPAFADTAGRDFHLSAGSPGIDAGDPAFAYDPDGTVTDMGAYWFDQHLPAAALSDTALDFGEVHVGEQANMAIYVCNRGTGNLAISGLANNLPVFTTDHDPADSVVAPGDSLALTVTFTPADSIAYQDTLQISTNDLNLSVALAGTGLPPTGVAGRPEAAPRRFALQPCRPNPARGQAFIDYQLPKACPVLLEIYNITGQMVERFREGYKQPGYYSVNWNAARQPAGVYFYRLRAGQFAATRKLVLIK